MTGSRVNPGCGGGSAQNRAPEGKGKLDRSILSVSTCQEMYCGAVQHHQSTGLIWKVKGSSSALTSFCMVLRRTSPPF